MALNNYFQITKKRPQPKLWLCKPNYSRIDRVKEVSNISGSFKYNNNNQLTFTIPTEVFNEGNHEQQRNELLDTVRNKYVIEFQYINFKDYFVIDEVKKISGDNDKIEIVANSVATELNKKSVNEIKLLASTIKQIMDLTLSSYAPLWTLDYVDPKIENVKRELEMQQSTVAGVVDQINTLFDSVVVFNSVNRTISFYHKDNAGINRGLRVRENSYLKSFEDSLVSIDVITRLYPVGKEGLSINSVNPAGTDYIEDFSYFIKPFKRDENRNVIQHSNYMSDELCHALLDYQELYKSKVQEGKDITERYTNLLKDWTTQDLKLRELEAIKTQLEDRVELLKPKNEYVEYGNIKKSTTLSLAKSSYYLIMIKNYGSLARIKVKGVAQDVKANDWTYIKVDTDDFVDATKYKEKAIVPIEIVSATSSLDMTVTRSSKADFEDMEIKDLEKKYNYIKYREEYASQFSIVNALSKRLKDIEQEKVNLIDQLRPEKYLTPKLYNERELYVMSGVWQEENHTVAQELYDDAIKQLGQKNNSSRSVSIGLVNFTQSLEHEEDWDKLNAGEVLVFSNKVFGEKLKAYITDLNISFEDNQVQVTISDVFDFKDVSQRISETLATATSSATQINFQKEQIRKAKNDISKILEIVNGKIDTRKQIITAGGETIELNSKGIMNMEVGNREAYIIQNNGVISATRNNGNSHVVLADTKGLNAESIKGSMILSNDTRIRNEDGSIYIDDEGIVVAKDKFKLVDNSGLDVLEQIRREQQDKIEELAKVYDQKLNQLVDESTDVEKSITKTSNYLVEAFKDSFITEFEQRKIEEHLAQLDKENNEYENQIEMALNHPYILPEDYIELSEAYTIYQGMYETLIDNIVESISDKKITDKESQLINESIIAFREEVKDILLLVQQVLETTRNTQIDSKVEKVADYATRIQEDMQDEVADLEKSIKDINDEVREAIGDGVFTAAEIEVIKNSLLVMTSENRDISNRHESIIANPNLPLVNVESIKSVYKAYNDKFNELVNHINAMMEDKQADEEEIQTYQILFNQLSEAKKNYLTAHSEAILIIAKAYSEDAKSQALGAIESLKSEYTNDLKDLSQSVADYKKEITEAFSDGIVTSTEKARLKTHQEIIIREKQDLDKNYNDLYSNPLLAQVNKSELENVKLFFDEAFENLSGKIDEVIKDDVINDLENEQAKQALTSYDIAFSNYSNTIQKAINSLSKSVADKAASDKVNAFSGVISSIQGDISSIQKQVDGAIDTWYYNYDPTLSNLPASEWNTNEIKNAHVGDFFLNNKTGNAYRFTLNGSTYAWTLLTDQAIADALRNANKAQDTADNKRRVFVDTPRAPYDVGDMWVQGTSGDIMVSTVAKSSTQVYSASDWTKASKYTDDTVAKEALNTANSTKQNFESFSISVVKDFSDGIITEAEMTRLKTHLDIIEKDYVDLTTKVVDLSKSNELNILLKNELSSSESRYKADYKVLKESIISYIADKKITQLEKDNIATYLNSYATSLSNLTLSIQKCLNNISETMATNKAKEAVDNLEIGGRNLIEDTASMNKDINKTWGGYNQLHMVDIASANSKLKVGDTVTLSFDVQMTVGTYLRIYDSNGQIDKTIGEKTYTNIGNTKQRLSYTTTLKASTKNNARWMLAFYNNNNGDKFIIENIKLELGNKATDYTLAPEDIDSQFATLTKETGNLKSAVQGLQGTINAGFADGIVTQAEAKAINQSKLQLEKEKKDLDGQYNGIYNSVDLTDEAIKTELKTAKDNYDASYRILVDSITSAISDGKATPQESATVTSNFADYSNKIGILSEKLSLAYDRLSLVRAEKIRVGGKNILNNSDFSLGSKYWLTNGTASFEVVDGYSVAKITNLNEQGIYQTNFPLEDDFYVLSFKAKAVGSVSRLKIGLLNQPTGKSGYFDLTNTWKTYSIPFTATALNTSKTFHIYSTPQAQQGFYITQVQLEKGNKPTDWTPSLADTEEKTNTAISTATTNWTKTLNAELGALKNPDSFPASAIKVEALLTDKLMSQALLAEKLVANNAFVNNLMANSIVTQKIQTTDLDLERLRTNVNKLSQSISIQSEGVVTSSNGETLSVLNQHGHSFYRNSKPVGIIGTGVLQNYPDVQGLRLSLNTEGSYVAFSFQNNATQDTANTAMIWNKAKNGIFKKGFMFFEDVMIGEPRSLETKYIRPTNFGGDYYTRLVVRKADLGGANGVGLHFKGDNGSGIHISENKVSILPIKTLGDEIFPTEFGVDSIGAFVKSPAIHNRRYSSYVGNVIINSNSTLGLPTSSKRYKDFIENQEPTFDAQIEHSKKVLQLDLKTWYDKQVLEDYAKEIETGERNENDVQKVERAFGLIAEDVDDLGLKELVIYDEEGQVDALHYEKIALHLIPLVKDLYKKIEKLETKTNE